MCENTDRIGRTLGPSQPRAPSEEIPMDSIRPEMAFQNLLDLRITSVIRILYLSKLRVTLIWIALTGQITLLREPRALPSAMMTVAFQADNLI